MSVAPCPVVMQKCHHCSKEFEKPMIRSRTNTTWCIIGTLLFPIGLICVYSCQDPVRLCPQCRKPLNGTYWC